MSEENTNKMKDIYILSKQAHKNILNTNILKKNEITICFDNEKEYNNKYKNKNISILKYSNEKKTMKIFGNIFVQENKKKCRIIINNKEKELKNYITINKKKKLKLKLEIYEYIISIKEMFKGCQEIRIIKKLNIFYVKNMSGIFSGCSTLSSLPDISKWNTNNVINMSNIFSFCSSLSSLPDISKWNTNNVINMSHIFYMCSSLSSLPDISKWKTNNVINMNDIFSRCSSLSSLPDISKWNTNNVINMSNIFSY